MEFLYEQFFSSVAIKNGYLSVFGISEIYVSNILSILYGFQFCCKTTHNIFAVKKT